jgi:hypothetical protein
MKNIEETKPTRDEYCDNELKIEIAYWQERILLSSNPESTKKFESKVAHLQSLLSEKGAVSEHYSQVFSCLFDFHTAYSNTGRTMA